MGQVQIDNGCRSMMACRRKVSMKGIFWFVVFPLLLLLYTFAWWTPARWWYEPGVILISDTEVGKDPIVSITRTIHKSFDGRYTVSIWKDPPDGHVSCAGSDHLRYRGGLFEPHQAPLTQWADDPWCGKLPVGKYYAEVCWTIIRPYWGIIPDKTICTTSNMFSIFPKETG